MNKFEKIDISLVKWQLTNAKNYSGWEENWRKNFCISNDCYHTPFMKLLDYKMNENNTQQWTLKT